MLGTRYDPTERQRTATPAGTIVVMALWFIVGALTLYLGMGQGDFTSQIYLSAALLGAMYILKLNPENRFWRVAFLGLATFIVLRYFTWRTLYTIEYTDPLSFACAIVLYLAEGYGIMIFIIGNFVNVYPLSRVPVALSDSIELPTVDIFVPSYNESTEILEVTLMAAIQMRYQTDKRTVYLLDDGGTDQRCSSPDGDIRERALERRATLEALCNSIGVTYLTRKRNEHAKAGNINEAFRKTKAELIVIFDADHIPTLDFLEKTVGYFAQDTKLFLVQTPHFFTNPDPVERNLETFEWMPSEQEMFYKIIQKGLDFWNASFFCGSGAVLRRRILEEIGGISTQTITEDAETALTLHALGYNSLFVPTPLLSGLATETMSSFIGQRTRWAQGMIQIILLKCPLFLRGLTLPQRLCYFNSCIFWLFPFPRIIYLLSPLAFLVFGLKIYAASWQTFCSFGVPHLIAVLTVSSYLFGKVRWSCISELYELIQSVYILPAVLSTLANPRAPTFKVTAKGERLSDNFISPLAWPFYLLAAINFTTVAAGIYRIWESSEYLYPAAITLFWSSFNSILLLATLGALYERRQRRSTPRIPSNVRASLIVADGLYPCSITDLSLGGCQLRFKGTANPHLEEASSAFIRVAITEGEPDETFHLTLRNVRKGGANSEWVLGAEFSPQSLQERMAKVRLVTGSSKRWELFQNSRDAHMGVIRSFFCLARLGLKYSGQHLAHLLGRSPQNSRGERPPVESPSIPAAPLKASIPFTPATPSTSSTPASTSSRANPSSSTIRG